MNIVNGKIYPDGAELPGLPMKNPRPPAVNAAMPERITAWRCIGCGRIEGAQPCIGICEDRKAEFVYAADYDRLVGELAQARLGLAAMTAVLRQIASTTPRSDGWERTYRVFQQRARRILETPVAASQVAQAGPGDAQA